jgi:hypothetical protein
MGNFERTDASRALDLCMFDIYWHSGFGRFTVKTIFAPDMETTATIVQSYRLPKKSELHSLVKPH